MSQSQSLLLSDSNRRGYTDSCTASHDVLKIPSMSRHNNFLSFLAVVQYYHFDFVPTTWHEAPGSLGKGATSEIEQSNINTKRSFAFKRAALYENVKEDEGDDWGGASHEKVFNTLVSEISILGHPLMRYHQNIVRLEGICWDVPSDSRDVRPVLILEKADVGDLRSFMCTEEGRRMDIEQRLHICLDIASAITSMHDCRKSHNFSSCQLF
jgi:hypothetical protein